MRRTTKLFALSITLTAASCGAWEYTAPDRAIASLTAAAKNRDAATVNYYIDFPVLRSNLNAQFKARLMANYGVANSSNPEFVETRSRSIEAMVDGMISPQAIQVAMDRAAELSEGQHGAASIGLQPIKRDGLNRFHVPIDPADTMALRFERQGLDWKITDIKLPYDLKKAFARTG